MKVKTSFKYQNNMIERYHFNMKLKKAAGTEITTIYRAEYTAMRETIARQKLEIEALEFRIKSLMHGACRK